MAAATDYIDLQEGGMGVCAVVKQFAEAVAHTKQPHQWRHKLLIEILKLMPLYAKIKHLGAWEYAFQQVSSQVSNKETLNTEIGELLLAIYEFGRFNLYAAFDQEGTDRELAALVDLLQRGGVYVGNVSDVTDW
jgi:hypothetical protein